MKTFIFLSLLIFCVFSKKNLHTKYRKSWLSSVSRQVQAGKFEPIPPVLPSSAKTNKDAITDFLSGRGMNKGEIIQIYRTLDRNFDGQIGSNEWTDFYKYFVLPFEHDCKPNEFYLIDDNEFISCFCKSKSFSHIRSILSLKEDDKSCNETASGIVSVIYAHINLADFVLLQRAQTAWDKCADGGYLGKTKLACALQITIPGYKVIHQDDVSHFFDLAISMVRGRLTKSLYLDFPAFLHFAKIYTSLFEVQRPIFKEGINYQEFMKALDNRLFELNLNMAQINRLFETFPNKIMSNSAFLTLVHAARIFNFYDADESRGLNQTEFLGYLADKNFDKLVLHEIAQIKDVSLTDESGSESSSAGKESFILNFLEMKKKTHHRVLKKSRTSNGNNLASFEVNNSSNPEISNRKLMFSIFGWKL